MKDKNNNKGVIILLIFIIIILLILVVLFATGTIILNTNKEESNKETIVDENNNATEENIHSNEEEILISNQNIYAEVINEYKNAILDNNQNNSNYKYVNENAIHHYFNQKGTDYEFNFQYSFYDINKDGSYEMLINNGIVDVFSYDGNNIIRLFASNANCLAESRCVIKLYEDGTIYFSGSGGANSQYIRFYNINKNISTLNTINSYYLIYGNNGNVSIYDEKTYDFNNDTGTKLNYNSSEELLSANIQNANQVDLNTLNWIVIN